MQVRLRLAVSSGSLTRVFTPTDYLIIVFVGLVLVLIAGLCLSAWCCKGACFMIISFTPPLSWHGVHSIGSFQNPLCCPCYLCACCGGLGKQDVCIFTLTTHHLSMVSSLLGMHWMRIMRRRIRKCMITPGWWLLEWTLDMDFFSETFLSTTRFLDTTQRYLSYQ